MEKNTTRISIRHSNVQLHSLVDGVINSGLNARLDGLPISIKGFFLKWILLEKFVQANYFSTLDGLFRGTWLRMKRLHVAKEYGSVMAAINLNYQFQSEKQTAAHPILSLTNVGKREMKIQHSKGIYYSVILWEMDGQQVEGGQYKSIPALPTLSGFCNLKSKIILKNNNNKQKFNDLFSFLFPVCKLIRNDLQSKKKKKRKKKVLNQSETVVVMLLGLIAQSVQLASSRFGFLLAISFNYFIVELHNQMRYYTFTGSLIWPRAEDFSMWMDSYDILCN